MSDGTGIVHIAPAFGEDDANVGRKYDLPFVQFVDGQGNLTEETPYAGVFVKKADPLVLTDLEKENKLFSAPKFEHEYPHCWRCDTPLIYYARESWFIKMTAVKEDLIRNNDTINWIPESIGKGRFGDWLKNVQDWGISRNRYWGTPLNIWECKCGKLHSVGSIEELKSMSDNCPDDIELHRPFIDDVTIKCPDCGRDCQPAKEEAYFFKMSKYADKLIEHINTHPEFIQPVSRKNEMMNNFLLPGLQDLCVSRTSFKWGVPVDFDDRHVVYVWLDALTNYITGIGYDADGNAITDPETALADASYLANLDMLETTINIAEILTDELENK